MLYCITLHYIILYLALINRAGGLYGRILTEDVSTDRGQDSPIQTDLARLIYIIIYVCPSFCVFSNAPRCSVVEAW